MEGGLRKEKNEWKQRNGAEFGLHFQEMIYELRVDEDFEARVYK